MLNVLLSRWPQSGELFIEHFRSTYAIKTKRTRVCVCSKPHKNLCKLYIYTLCTEDVQVVGAISESREIYFISKYPNLYVKMWVMCCLRWSQNDCSSGIGKSSFQVIKLSHISILCKPIRVFHCISFEEYTNILWWKKGFCTHKLSKWFWMAVITERMLTFDKKLSKRNNAKV